MKYIVSIIIILIFFNHVTHAQDRVFAYTYQTNVLNKGDFDLEFQNTLRTGKVGEFSPYVFGQHLDQRLELEFGLGSNIQTSFYLNSERFDYAHTSSTGMNSDLKISFSNEWKWKLSDPVANAIGSTLYAELEFGGDNIELETKLILDKRIVNDLFAMNIVSKYEIERQIVRLNNVTEAIWIHNSPVEFNFGYMHFFNKDFSVGIEARNNNDIIQGNGWMNSVWFAGPAFHFTIGRCFVLFTALPQLVNTHKTVYAPGNRDLNDFEAAEFRLLAGYDF
jgi:hypothetical protein